MRTLVITLSFAVAFSLTIYVTWRVIRARRLETSDAIALLAIVVSILIAFSTYTYGTFGYQVRVQAQDTGQAIQNAKVTIETGGIAPLDEFTDNNGFARFIIDTSHAGKPGRLTVEAANFQRFVQNIDLVPELLPDTIQLEPVS